MGTYCTYCRSEEMPAGIFRGRPGVDCELDRLPSTAVRNSAGLNGFCKLDTAPSLVAMCKKSGWRSEANRNCCPEITITGICGRD